LKPGVREQLPQTTFSFHSAIQKPQSISKMSTKLFVGNLSFNTTENDLQDLFAAYGPVQQVDMIMDRMTGRPRGFGFVTMENQDDAKKAIEALHGKPFGGRDLTVNEARPREDRPGGGGGGGGRGFGGGGGGYGGGGGGGRDRGDRGGGGDRRGGERRERY
jgi:RNA recognition motif-containing protein